MGNGWEVDLIPLEILTVSTHFGINYKQKFIQILY